MILECVPNFSEGRRREICEELKSAVVDVKFLGLELDADHNRSVLTFVGEPGPLAETAIRVATVAVRRIDLNHHEGQHPRMGAIDVLPFVPLTGATMEDAVALARRVGERIGRELELPVFLYESAATRPDRKNLAEIRKPQFEGLRDLIGKDPERLPDFGPNRIHPTAGCVAVGARPALIAYNIDLETENVGIAKKIAKKIRERDGGLPGIKALGLSITARNCAQVSMNVCDFHKTGLREVFQAVEAEARSLGAAVRSSEIVGLCPQEALPKGVELEIKLSSFTPSQIIESHL